ncbi:MAG TPA: methyl-accepting chemotaxis protein, partial [Gemmatimonadaceae bacterium]|nr:methyl-accepting chemotaxis protein [Gemmatimonadaceae bacterium]
MNLRSTGTFMIPQATIASRSSRSLRRRLVAGVAVFAVAVLVLLTLAGLGVLRRTMAGDEDARVTNAASLSKQLVERVLAERERQVELIASTPSVVATAKKGADEARKLGLPLHTFHERDDALPAIEARFKATRSLQVDPSTAQYLAGLLPRLDIAEVMVTDRYGYNAVTTSPSSDFVQSDEGWWQTAFSRGATTASATFDSATRRVVVELSGVVRDGAVAVGVTKVKFGLSLVDSVLAQGSSGNGSLRVDLVDSSGKIIASSAGGERFTSLPGFVAVKQHGVRDVFGFGTDSTTPQRGALALANAGSWRVVAHINESDATHAYTVARMALFFGSAAMLVLIVFALGIISRFIERRVTGPAEQLATAAEAVANGDLSKSVSNIGGDDEVGRLARAIAAMISELRRLAMALNGSAGETANMTAEITASSEEMAAAAGQIAHTASDLSQQANLMAETIHSLAGASEHLVRVASDLDVGATEGVDRNARLRALALENRARLEASSHSLSLLSADAEASAAAIEQLAQASEEVKSFVTLVQKLARQSKLLALNAAMEAARAGEHGHGFAVVAEEVRRLATMSSDAAEATERVVNGVLAGVAQSRTSSERTVETARAVHSATEQGSRSFGQIEQAVADSDAWTSNIQKTVTAASGLARDMRGKLDTLAAGTESFAAAMEEVAASSEEQSASTEQIAAAAATLSGAAERLTRVVANLRLDDAAVPPAPARTSGPVRAPSAIAVGRSLGNRAAIDV